MAECTYCHELRVAMTHFYRTRSGQFFDNIGPKTSMHSRHEYDLIWKIEEHERRTRHAVYPPVSVADLQRELSVVVRKKGLDTPT